MSDCCTVPGHENRQCPECGARCRSVSVVTLPHRVKRPFDRDFGADEVFYYCPTARCRMAYFSAQRSILKSELEAFDKIRAGWLCYCFDISERRYREALNIGKADELKHFVVDKTQFGLCACQVRAPSGVAV